MSRSPKRALLHEKITTVLREEIRAAFRPGQQLPSEPVLANRFGVSLVTLRNATLTLVNEGLLERVHGKGVFVKERSPAERYVAVLSTRNCTQPVPAYFAMRLHHELLAQLGRVGQRVRYILCSEEGPDQDPQFPPADFLADIAGGRVAGIYVSGMDSQADWRKLAHRRNVPVVGMNPACDAAVLIDYPGIVRAGIRCLVAAGRRRLALMELVSNTPDVLHARDEILLAFRDELDRAGLAFRERWVSQDARHTALGAGWQDFRDLWSAYPDKPDGLVVVDDVMFRDAALAIRELRIAVPTDLLIATHAHRNDGMLDPFPVIRLEIDPAQVAAKLVEALTALMQCRPMPRQTTVPFTCVDRQAPGQAAQSVFSPNQRMTGGVSQ